MAGRRQRRNLIMKKGYLPYRDRPYRSGMYGTEQPRRVWGYWCLICDCWYPAHTSGRNTRKIAKDGWYAHMKLEHSEDRAGLLDMTTGLRRIGCLPLSGEHVPDDVDWVAREVGGSIPSPATIYETT